MGTRACLLCFSLPILTLASCVKNVVVPPDSGAVPGFNSQAFRQHAASLKMDTSKQGTEAERLRDEAESLGRQVNVLQRSL